MKMKQKIRPSRLVVCVILLFIVYFFLSFRPLGSELQIIPDWTINITSRATHKPIDNMPDSCIPFKLGQNMGYISPDGFIYNMTSFPFKASISAEYYTSYTSDASEIPFYTADGTKQGIINGTGFPYFVNDAIYLFPPGGNAVAEYNQDGSIRWQYDGITPILAFSATDSGCIVGFADGTIVAIDHNGKQIANFEPGGSDYSIILGADISNSGEYLACVSGIQRQRFVLTKQIGAISKVIFHEFLPEDQYTPVFVKFSQDENMVYFNYHNGLGIVSCATGSSFHLPISGQVLNIVEFTDQDIIFVLSVENSQYHVYLIEKEANLLGNFTFTANTAFIAGDSRNLYIGHDDTISRLIIQRQ